MRVAFIADAVAQSGVSGKLTSQVECWREEGHDVAALLLAPEGFALPGFKTFPWRTTSSRLTATRRVSRAVREFAPDLGYIRYDLFFPPLWRLARIAPVVIEVNTDDRVEYRLRGRLPGAYNLVNHRALFGTAVGAVFPTPELERRYAMRGFQGAGKVIGNSYPRGFVGRQGEPRYGEVRVAFVAGTGQPWHGLDRLARLASAMPTWTFDVIGIAHHEFVSSPPNVICHGQLPSESYGSVLGRCSLGLGALALDRTGLTESSSLKVRDYLAHALPVALASRDPDIPTDAWWALRLPKDDRHWPGALHSFVAGFGARRIVEGDVASVLSLTCKERARLDFFQQVIT